jgi:hypothetical protein
MRWVRSSGSIVACPQPVLFIIGSRGAPATRDPAITTTSPNAATLSTINALTDQSSSSQCTSEIAELVPMAFPIRFAQRSPCLGRYLVRRRMKFVSGWFGDLRRVSVIRPTTIGVSTRVSEETTNMGLLLRLRIDNIAS